MNRQNRNLRVRARGRTGAAAGFLTGRRAPAGFTLVERLVVVAIIGLLIPLILLFVILQKQLVRGINLSGGVKG